MTTDVQKTGYTFQDLYNYVKEVKTDNKGIVEFYPGRISHTKQYPYNNGYWGGHVYSTRGQINIISTSGNPELAIPLVNFVFTEDTVNIVKVNQYSGRADYDHPHIIPIDTSFDDISWGAAVGRYGLEIYLVLNSLITNFENDPEYNH